MVWILGPRSLVLVVLQDATEMIFFRHKGEC